MKTAPIFRAVMALAVVWSVADRAAAQTSAPLPPATISSQPLPPTSGAAEPVLVPAAVPAAEVAPYPTTQPSATSQTAPGTSAAARLQLIADDQQTKLTARQPDGTDAPPKPAAPPQGTDRDPTVPEIRQLLDPDATTNKGIPLVRLRARLILPGRAPTALIEVGGAELRVRQQEAGTVSRGSDVLGVGGHYRTVREGDEFSVISENSTTPVRVVKISAEEVIVEVTARKTMLRLD